MTDSIDTVELQGSCACKKVTVKASQASKNIGVCHCDTCRRLAGGPIFLVDCGTNVSFEGCLLYTSPSPRDATLSRMPSSA